MLPFISLCQPVRAGEGERERGKEEEKAGSRSGFGLVPVLEIVPWKPGSSWSSPGNGHGIILERCWSGAGAVLE
jgi:hypothetical protein